MVNNSTSINKHHLSLQLIERWSTIPPPISTKITPLFKSLSDGQQFHQYQQKSPLPSIHWVMVNNSTNINNNQLSLQLIERWSTIPPPISTKITSLFKSLSDGQQFHQYQQKSPLPSIHWVMVNNSTNINKNQLSHQLIEWWSTIPPISTKITSHLNSLSDGQQFHQYQQKSPLTSTHWVMVNNSTNINKNHLSPQYIEWWSTIPPISTKITSHLNSLSNGQQFHQYQQKSPLTSTHWAMVNNSTNINKNHLSPKLIEWWSKFHQYQQESPLTSTHWVISTIPPISTKITSHLNSLSDGHHFHQYQ
jgi:predicted secreted protein